MFKKQVDKMKSSCCKMPVDSKSFEISMHVFGEKLKGIIVKRSKGLTLWIKFGSLSLCCLLEGVEAYCRGEFVQRFVKSWEDGGRKFKLESRANEAGRGRGKNSYVDAVKTRARRLGEAVWLQLGEKDVLSGREFLDRCLVGKWGESPVSAPDLSALGSWGRSHWNIKGGVKFARLGGPFILIKFENKKEADKVLLRGHQCFKESFLHLERWDPKVGCSQNGEQVKKFGCGGRCNQGCRRVLGDQNGTGIEQEVREDGEGDSRVVCNVEQDFSPSSTPFGRYRVIVATAGGFRTRLWFRSSQGSRVGPFKGDFGEWEGGGGL
ncbi:hypothetical protein CK203_006749 [Vitis vinifera]|uniref:DUF4283 domain-containing protein n=1 Tax=Vitis vinifera TaxID=29760 RepID=A0A438KBF4_VITVI|nr:hypothetical protein CK203_006749 [Vitis vinifera]